jgi:uncharacterized protein (TIGR03492 family)
VLEVAFITDAPRVAGSEIWLLERLPRLDSLGLRPTLFLPQRPNLDGFAEVLERKGVRVRRYARLGEVLEATAIARKGSSQVWLLRGAFSAILNVAHIAIGTAGTANEQAAGMGIPVVGFPTPGPQYVYPNALRQSRLLGKALRLVEAKPEVVAATVRQLLSDAKALEEARREGIERNGPRGALPHIASEIRQELERKPR